MTPSHAARPARDWPKRSTGESTGRAMEPRNFYFGKPTLWLYAEGNNRTPINARRYDPARSKTLARMDALCTGTGRSRVRPTGAASGSLRTEADDERSREVGQTHSTGEVPELSQTDGGGGDGGKGSGQREPAPGKRVPGTVPGKARRMNWSQYAKRPEGANPHKRQDLRQEPDEVIPQVRIRAGGVE